MQYDTRKNALIWSKNLVYTNSSYNHLSNSIVVKRGQKSSLLDPKTGDLVWTTKHQMLPLDSLDNLGLGYKVTSSNIATDILQGIDFNNGNILWSREIKREYGWNHYFFLSDSVIAIVASGLHTINLWDGSGWDYDKITGEKDYTVTAATNIIGIATGLLTGTFIGATGYNLVSNVNSNPLIDSSAIVFASKEELVKIEQKTGEILWQSKFPPDFASKSTLIRNDSAVLMINSGYAHMGYRKIGYGKPFLAMYDLETGHPSYFAFMDVNKDPIKGFKIVGDEVIFLFGDRIARYSLKKGNKILSRPFHEGMYGEILGFVGDQVYYQNNELELIPLNEHDTSQLNIFTKTGKFLSINSNFNVEEEISRDDLHLQYLTAKNLRFISVDEKTIILNGTGERVAEIKATSDASLTGNTLIDYSNNRFSVINLTDLLE